MLTWGLIVIAVLMDVFGAFIVKSKLNEFGAVNFSSFSLVLGYLIDLMKFPLVLFGGFLILLAPIPYALALSRMDLSTTYPIVVGLNAIILFPLAVFFLNEQVTNTKIIGFAIIIIGLFFIK